MLKRLLIPFLAMILANIKSVNTRLFALEAGDIAEAADDAASEVEMQKLLDSMAEPTNETNVSA